MKRLFSFATFLFVLTIGVSAHATLVKSFDLTALCLKSDLIVQGVVNKLDTVYDAKSDRIYTEVHLSPTSILKGQEQHEIVLRQFGGEYQGRGMRAVGSPAFHEGEEVVLFLVKKEQHYFLRGMSQGAFTVFEKNTSDTHHKIVKQKFTDIGVVVQNPETGKAEIVRKSPEEMSMTEFLSRIQSILASK